jgi:hypothetical protein
MNTAITHRDVPHKISLKVADEVWIAAALLHREHADRNDFTVQEIIARARTENITGTLRPGVSVHAYLHCVANRPPNSAQYRMLYATGESARRLFRQSDEADPKRKGKITPEADDLPPQYRHLLDWYRTEYDGSAADTWLRGVLEMSGSGSEIFSGVDPDDYVRKLREGWD